MRFYHVLVCYNIEGHFNFVLINTFPAVSLGVMQSLSASHFMKFFFNLKNKIAGDFHTIYAIIIMVIQSHKAYKARICSLKQNAQLEMHIRNVESKGCINNGNL
jgi:hypothetical protein